jgi:hypothetical protein
MQNEFGLIISTIVGVTGIISLLYSVKQRKNPMRELLYKKQFELFEKLGEKVCGIFDNYSNRICFIKEIKEKKVDYSSNDNLILESAEDIEEMAQISKLYLPEEIYEFCIDLVSEIRKNQNFLSSEDSIYRIHQKSETHFNSLRTELGVEILHLENKNIIKKIFPF